MSTSVSLALTMITGTLDDLPDLPAYLGARKPGQHQVEQHDVGAVALELLERCWPGRGQGDVEALLAQHVRQGVAVALLVLDDENTGHEVSS